MSVNGSVGEDARPDVPAVSTILLVEDEATILRLASRILRRRGYTVLEAETGEEAVRVAAEHGGRIDVLLTDLIMPGLSGAEVARRIMTAHPAVQVVYMSGYGAEDLAEHGVGHPAHFLGKPFTPDALIAKIQEVLA
jgi:CheY-like chemotaxis protein